VIARRLPLALVTCLALACAFDPTGITLAGEWSTGGSIVWCGPSRLLLTQQGDSVSGTLELTGPPVVSIGVRGTQHGADLLFVDQGVCFSPPMKGRLTATDRFVLTVVGVDYIDYVTYRRQ